MAEPPGPRPSLVLARRGGEGLPVVYAGSDEAGRLASVELAGFLSRMADCRVSVAKQRPGNGPRLELVDGVAAGAGNPVRAQGDAFRRTVSSAGVAIEALTGRGLLFGVYDLLEDLGCRWYYPGPVGQRVPRLDEVRLPYGSKVEAPAFAERSLILGHDLYLADVEGWIEWAVRNRLSGLFLHDFPPPILGGRASAWWRQALTVAVPLARRCGLVVEFGGHRLAALLPRRLFGRHPEYFRHDGRRRTPDHNLCPASAEGLEVVRREARTFFETHPGADVYHLWPDDVPGGAWCRCKECSHLSPSDQALLVTNVVAEVLAEVAPGACLTHLAYHDTLQPPVKVRPAANVRLLYAPRERCYAHALDDLDCEVNRSYHGQLLAGVGAWPAASDAAGAGPAAAGAAAAGPGATGPAAGARVFEYYLDAVLFKSMLPPLTRTMARDLRAYLGAGVDAVGVLMTSDRSWVAVPPNLWLWGRLTWNPETDLWGLLSDFAGGVLGDPGLAGYYATLEEAFAGLLELDGQTVSLRLPGAGLLDAPPVDTLDFLDGSPAALERKLSQLRAAATLVDQARGRLAAAGSRATGADVPSGVTLAGERADVELVADQVAYLEARQEAVGVVPDPEARHQASGPAPERREAIARAWRALRRIAKWGRGNLAGGLARAQFSFMHAPWELQLLLLERTRGQAPGASGPEQSGAAGPDRPGPRLPRHRIRDYRVLGGLALRYAVLRLWALRRRRPTPFHRTSG